MNTTFRTALLALLAVLALSAVAAGAAQAEEAPFFKVAGARLAKGESKTIAGKGGRVTVAFSTPYTQCIFDVGSGGSVIGSNAGNPGTGEMTVELSECSALQTECPILNQPVKSTPLVATLVQLEQGKGRLALWLKPKTGKTLLEMKLGEHCPYGTNLQLTGSVAAELYSGGSPVELKKEPAEGKSLEIRLPGAPIKHVWYIASGLGETKEVALTVHVGGGELAAAIDTSESSPLPLLELTSGANWGVFV